MAGQRQPTDLLLFKGKKHLTKKEIEQRKKSEVKAKIEPPNILTKKQKDRFQEIAAELCDIGIMSNLDVDALARFIIHQSEYEKITRSLRRTKLEEIEKYETLLKLQEKHFKMCRQSSMDLGLTISSRCKLVIPTKEEEKPKTKEEKLFGDRL